MRDLFKLFESLWGFVVKFSKPIRNSFVGIAIEWIVLKWSKNKFKIWRSVRNLTSRIGGGIHSLQASIACNQALKTPTRHEIDGFISKTLSTVPWANEWAQQSARAKNVVRSKWSSGRCRCEGTSERMSEWSSALHIDFIPSSKKVYVHFHNAPIYSLCKPGTWSKMALVSSIRSALPASRAPSVTAWKQRANWWDRSIRVLPLKKLFFYS